MFSVESVERVGVCWPRDAVKRLQSGGFQACLASEGEVWKASRREFALNNVVLSVLETALLQEEKDDQQAVIYCVFKVFKFQNWDEPNYEAVRRAVQHLQNTLGIAPISEEEKRDRKEKANFVRGKWCKK